MAESPRNIPTELDMALEAERAKSLRFRFLLYCYVGIALSPLGLIPTVARMFRENSPSALFDLYPLSIFLTGSLTIAAIVKVHLSRSASSRQVLRIAFWLYVLSCVITLAADRLKPFEHSISGRAPNSDANVRATTRRAAERAAAATQGVHELFGGAVVFDVSPPRSATGPTTRKPPSFTNDLLDGFVQGAEAAEREKEEAAALRYEKSLAATRAAATSGSTTSTTSTTAKASVELFADSDEASTATGWALRTPISLGFIHFFACLFLPWRFKESLKPAFFVAAFVACVTSIDVLTGHTGAWALVVLVLVAPSVVMPGSLICWWRYSRFRSSFSLKYDAGKYHQLRHELEAARQVHESCLPRRLIAGPIRLDYAYEPMRSIGGDLVYMHPRDTWGASGAGQEVPTTLLVLDVAGHGVAAALTVNRLVGEIERLFAEEPHIAPADLLNRLNRYVWLTLSRYSLYVTATAAQIDRAAGKLHFASAGHPTAFIRGGDGSLTPLESTTFLLGAVEGEDFGRAQIDMPFGTGDSLILYTDGATEARDPAGTMLGTEGLVQIIQSLPAIRPTQEDGLSPGAWSYELLHRVRQHRQAPPDDDTLVVVLCIPPEADAHIPSIPYVPVARLATPVN
jgi:serine phosphatase RsbU (regulator of sigma subunit)